VDKASSSSYIYIKLITYFIFLYSGLIKWIPFPVDFTLLFGLLTLIFIVYDIYTGEIRLYNINVGYLYLLFYIFSISYMLTYFYSESKVYSIIKVRGFLLNIIAFTFPITSIKIQDSNKIIRVLTVFALLVLIFLSFLLYNDLFNLVKMSDEDQLNLFFTTLPTYLDFGAFIAISFILLINNNSIFSIIFKLIIFYFLIILGGRGPLLTLIFIVFINFLFNNRKLVTVGYFKYLFFLVVGVALYIYFDLTFIDFERLNVFKNYGDDESVSGRFVFVQRCLEGFMDKPILGNGIGSTGVLISGQDIVLYPHNLFVEVLSEFGLIGFFLYLSIFLFFLWIVIIKKVSAEYLPFLFIVLYLFSQDMKSGAFEAWRISCGWLSIATILINYNFNITEKILVNEKVV
jgi:O-antigen ligase